MMCLNNLKERIEIMQKYHQIEILRILNKYKNIKFNENKNGTFINLTELPENIITELEKYINYVEEQQKHLKIVETEKETIEQTFFTT
jgi:hypothetical protein